MDINGFWTGIINLEKGYRKYSNNEIVFDLEINQKGQKFEGVSIDVKGFGINTDPAKIEGELENTRIKFVKQYESLHYLKGGEKIIDKSRKGPEIYYSGKYNEKEKRFEGEWHMNPKQWIFGIIPMRIKGSGIWQMKRTK